MKHTTLLLILAFAILAGCKPKSEAKNGFDMPGVGNNNNKNNSNNSGSSGSWSNKYREKMTDELKSYAEKEVGNNTNINDFVDCAINKLEAKFPNENVDPQNSEAQSILHACESGSSNNQSDNSSNSYNSRNSSEEWSNADQQEFLDNCVPGASKSLAPGAGKDYCNCMLKKLMIEYPNSKDISNASQSHLKELATDCKNREETTIPTTPNNSTSGNNWSADDQRKFKNFMYKDGSSEGRCDCYLIAAEKHFISFNEFAARGNQTPRFTLETLLCNQTYPK